MLTPSELAAERAARDERIERAGGPAAYARLWARPTTPTAYAVGDAFVRAGERRVAVRVEMEEGL